MSLDPASGNWTESALYNYDELQRQAATEAFQKTVDVKRTSTSLANLRKTNETPSPESSVSLQSMRDSSPDSPPLTPANPDSLASKARNLTLQGDKQRNSAIKRECAASVHEGPPKKQLHSASDQHDSQPSLAIGPRVQRLAHQRTKHKDRKSNPVVQRRRSCQTPPLQNKPSLAHVERPQSAVQPAAHGRAQDRSQAGPPQGVHSPKSFGSGRPSPQTKTQFHQKPPKLGSHATEPGQPPPPPRWKPLMQSSTNPEYQGMLLQPDSSPISESQLAAEIQGIYEGVATVEQKCIDIDAALARDTKTRLGPEQEQALIALHRTLLYEHHDFLMATQHPSAGESLRALAMKHSMPARMWKHGIHAFLEVLRHRRPDSQEYMLAFVVLAYQMMALLYETVPSFTDTWIECLGDLARYRMAIEEDREMHAVWGGVAARWYTLASDRHPEIGRLYHHLGILERPSMRKFAAYAKSLTCSTPFVNARDSMATFCTPIVQEEHLSRANVGSPEALLVTFFALVFLRREADTIRSIATNGLNSLASQPAAKVKDFGPHSVLASIAAVFEFGSSQNQVWISFSAAISIEQKQSRPSTLNAPGTSQASGTPSIASTSASAQVMEFHFACFNALTRPQNSSQSNSDVLPSVHVILAWFYSLNTLTRGDDKQSDTIRSLLDPSRYSWGGLCLFLNGFCQDAPIEQSVLDAARSENGFPGAGDKGKFIPLAEDYWMRGLLWAKRYPPTGILPARADEIESPKSGLVREQRVQWLALSLAFNTEYINYDPDKKAFYAPVQGPMPRAQPARVDSIASTSTRTDFAPSSRSTTWATKSSTPTSPTPSRSSTTVSVAEDEDGYTLVGKPKPKSHRWASVASSGATKKARERSSSVQIYDADEYQFA